MYKRRSKKSQKKEIQRTNLNNIPISKEEYADNLERQNIYRLRIILCGLQKLMDSQPLQEIKSILFHITYKKQSLNLNNSLLKLQKQEISVSELLTTIRMAYELIISIAKSKKKLIIFLRSQSEDEMEEQYFDEEEQEEEDQNIKKMKQIRKNIEEKAQKSYNLEGRFMIEMDFEKCQNGIQEYVYKDIQEKIAELEQRTQKDEGNKMLDMQSLVWNQNSNMEGDQEIDDENEDIQLQQGQGQNK